MTSQEAHVGEGTRPGASLPRRLLDAFFSPDRMAKAVASDPRWLGAMSVCAALLAVSVTLIPADIMAEVQRRAMIERGQTPQAMTDQALLIFRIATPAFALIGFTVFSFLFAGVYTVIFPFVLGDEGTYKQYLAVSVHAAIIPTVVAVALAPLRIAQEDPTLTLNLGSFLAFMPDSFVASVLRYLDVTQLWAAAVMAQGFHAIDSRRSWGSAAGILLAMHVVIAIVVALVVARFGMG